MPKEINEIKDEDTTRCKEIELAAAELAMTLQPFDETLGPLGLMTYLMTLTAMQTKAHKDMQRILNLVRRTIPFEFKEEEIEVITDLVEVEEGADSDD